MCLKALEDLVKNASGQSPPSSDSVGVVLGLVPRRDPHIEQALSVSHSSGLQGNRKWEFTKSCPFR